MPHLPIIILGEHMFVDLVLNNNIETSGNHLEAKIIGSDFIVDGEAVAFFNRDESFWSKDEEGNKIIQEIIIRP